MKNYELLLTKQAEDNIDDTLNTLILAAQEIAIATEKDFEEIKGKRWYVRLWGLVMFNNDNQKVQARGVGNIAKLNEIIMKAVVLISKKSADNALKVLDCLKETSCLRKDVDDLYQLQIKIIKAVQKIKQDFEVEERFDELNENQRDILFAVFCKYIGCNTNEYTQKLLTAMHSCVHETYSEIDFNIIDAELKQSTQKMLFSLLHGHSLLLNETLADENDEIFDYIALSEKAKIIIRNSVQMQIKQYGKDGYISLFEAPGKNGCYKELKDISTVSDEEIEFQTPNIETESEDVIAEEIEEEFNYTNDTFLMYWDLISFFAEYFPDNCRIRFVQDEVQFNDQIVEKIYNFINKNHLNIEANAALCVFDTTFFGGAKDGVLLTTWGLYYKETFNDTVFYVSYNDMNNISIILNTGSERSIKISTDIIIPENKVPSNFASVLGAVHDKSIADPNFTAYDDLFYDMSKLDKEYKKLYITTLAEIFCSLSASVKNKGILLAYLMCKACNWNLDLNELSNVWGEKISDKNVMISLKKLKQDCPYPMYSIIQKELIKDIYRINYELNKNTLPKETDDLINNLMSLYSITSEEINTDAVLFDLRIADNSLTNEQMNNVDAFIEKAGAGILTGSIGFLAGIFSAHPIAAVSIGILGSIFNDKASDARYNNIRVEVLTYLKNYYMCGYNNMNNYPLVKTIISEKIQMIKTLINRYKA